MTEFGIDVYCINSVILACISYINNHRTPAIRTKLKEIFNAKQQKLVLYAENPNNALIKINVYKLITILSKIVQIIQINFIIIEINHLKVCQTLNLDRIADRPN